MHILDTSLLIYFFIVLIFSSLHLMFGLAWPLCFIYFSRNDIMFFFSSTWSIWLAFWACLLLWGLGQLWGSDPSAREEFLLYIPSKHSNLNSSHFNFVHAPWCTLSSLDMNFLITIRNSPCCVWNSTNSHSKSSRKKKILDKAVAYTYLDLESIFCCQLCSCKYSLVTQIPCVNGSQILLILV